MTSTIDLYGSPGNPVVDITGQLLGIDLFFADKGSSIQTDHALGTFLPFLGLTQAELSEIDTILSTPLSTYFDNSWAVNHVSSKASVVDIVVPESRPEPHPHPPPPPTPPPTVRNTIEQLIWEYLAKASGEDYVIQNNYNLPTTGTLRSVVVNNTNIYLAYGILGNFFDWTVTTNTQCGAEFTISFDFFLEVEIDIPDGPGQPFPYRTNIDLERVNINADNWCGDLIQWTADLISAINGQGWDFFGTIEGQIQATAEATPLNINALSSILSVLPQGWSAASPFGFTSCTALIPSNALELRLIHPIDPAPKLYNSAAPPYPIITSPSLSTDAETRAGETITVNCYYFPLAEADQISVYWTDTTSGTPTYSDLMWGPSGGTQTQIRIPRSFDDNKNFYNKFTGVQPNTRYTFAVQDEDYLTITPVSNTLTITTDSSDQLGFYLVQGNEQWPLSSTATLGTSSTITLSLTIPSSQSAGLYNLSAQHLGTQLASTPIQILSSTSQNPIINLDTDRIMAGSPLITTFQGFNTGLVNLLVETSEGYNVTLGEPTSPGAGSWTQTYTWPQNVVIGNSIVVAQMADGSQGPAEAQIITLATPH